MTFNEILLVIGCIVGVVIVFGIPIYIVMKGIDKWKAAADRRKEEIFREANSLPLADVNESLVEFQFWTWECMILTTRETAYSFKLPYSRALFLLKKLYWYNFKWGIWGGRAVIVPFLNMINYFVQKRKIARQLRDARREG